MKTSLNLLVWSPLLLFGASILFPPVLWLCTLVVLLLTGVDGTIYDLLGPPTAVWGYAFIVLQLVAFVDALGVLGYCLLTRRGKAVPAIIVICASGAILALYGLRAGARTRMHIGVELRGLRRTRTAMGRPRMGR